MSDVQMSARGVPVQVIRSPHLDCPKGSSQVEIRYGNGGHGKQSWFPATRAEAIERVRDLYLADKDSLGKERPDRPGPKRRTRGEDEND